MSQVRLNPLCRKGEWQDPSVGLQNPGAGADQGPMHLTWQRWGLAIPPSDTADLDELETWIL
jgi:hypothetical protein